MSTPRLVRPRLVRPRRSGVPREVLEQALVDVAGRSGALGVELVDVAGGLDSVARRVAAQAGTVEELAAAAAEVGASAAAVAGDAERVREGAQHAVGRVAQSRDQVQQALGGVAGLADWVARLGTQLEEVTRSLRDVSDAARAIDAITGQTHILALNARIEAARSGEAGRGFAVIADSVKQLAEQTAAAATSVSETVSALAEPLLRLQQEGHGAGVQAERARGGADVVVSVLGDVDAVLGEVGDSAARIAVRAQSAEDAVAATSRGLADLATGMGGSRDDVASADARVAALLEMSEGLLQATAASGAPTADTPFVAAVQGVAAQVQALLAAELAAGRCTEADLFDEVYAPVPRSDPEQVTTRFTAITDRLLPAVQEPVLGLDPRVVSCATVDRNGYLPTNNRAYNHPQGSDPAWNAAHCRSRRVFADRTGLAAAGSTAPFLLQTYRRDMGGGTFALMKDVSAPVVVAGRHWGAVRLAYRV